MHFCNGSTLPPTPGSYILWLHLDRERRIAVGRLGEVLFKPGYYAYCGSAFGPGGLRARLSHHLRKTDKPRWHVDYLKNISKADGIWYLAGPENHEHLFATRLSISANAKIIIAKFGASDCKCSSHLFHFPTRPRHSDDLVGFPKMLCLRIERGSLARLP